MARSIGDAVGFAKTIFSYFVESMHFYPIHSKKLAAPPVALFLPRIAKRASLC